MAELMDIWQLQKYAEDNGGYKSGRFLCVNENGIWEMKWLDAYFGLIEVLQLKPKERGFLSTKDLREFFGDEQKYLPTIGYDTDGE